MLPIILAALSMAKQNQQGQQQQAQQLAQNIQTNPNQQVKPMVQQQPQDNGQMLNRFGQVMQLMGK